MRGTKLELLPVAFIKKDCEERAAELEKGLQELKILVGQARPKFNTEHQERVHNEEYQKLLDENLTK